MKKILNYITNGQGFGIKIILLTACLVSLIFSLYIRIAGAELVPFANDVVNQMLPLKVQNGVIVEPVNTIRVAHLNDGDVSLPLPIVLDTTIDELDTSRVDSGIYMTRTKIYAVNNHDVRIHNYGEEDFELYPADYSDGILSALTWTAVALFFADFVIVFVFFLIAALFYSVCAQILGMFLSKKMAFDVRMRLSTLCFLAIYILFFVLNQFGISNSRLVFFVVTLVLQAYAIYKIVPNTEILPEVEEKQTEETRVEEAEKIAEPEKKAHKNTKTTKKPVKKVAKAKAETTKKKAPAKKAPAKKKTPAKKKAEK